jgi:3-phenylpropionate/trans-cinnamate dioxygenase ferredoxin subunit
VFNCAGTIYAIEDRCSHAEASLGEGELDQAECTVECPRHGAKFDLKSGKALTLPAYAPVETFAVQIQDQMIKLEVS